jgi:hypothetical protein
MDINEITRETLEKATELTAQNFAKAALAKATADGSSYLTGYNLKDTAILLQNLSSEWRKSIPRRTVGGKQFDYRRIVSVTPSGSFFATDGARSNGISLTTDSKSVSFASYGRFYDVSWEAVLASKNFEDVRSRVQTLAMLEALKEEEAMILGATVSAVGAPTGLSVVGASSGGSLGAATYYATVCAVTMEGVIQTVVARPDANGKFDASLNVPSLPARGVSPASTEANSGALSGSTNQLTLTCGAVKNAVAYLWGVGTSTGAEKLQCVTTAPKVVITNINTTGAALPSSDTTANSGGFTGIIPQLNASGSGAYVKTLGAKLSSPTGSHIPEVADALQAIYDATKTQPSRIVCGGYDARVLDAAYGTGPSNDRVNYYVSMGPQGPVFQPVRQVPSPIDGSTIPIEVSAWLPGGTFLLLQDRVTYPSADIPAPWEMVMGADVTGFQYAQTKPTYEAEVRLNGALVGYAPVLQGMLVDVRNY